MPFPSSLSAIPDSLHEVACEHAATVLKRIADSTDTAHIPNISTGVMEGTAARTIARATRELNADLLVIGTRGEHQSEDDPIGRGGNAAKIVHDPAVPVLLLHREPVAAAPMVLAPVDLKPISSLVIQ